MPKKRDDEIESKLEKLELALHEEELKEEELARKEKGKDPAGVKREDGAVDDGDIKSDLYMIGGLVCLAVGILMVFSNIKIGTGTMSWFGMGAGGAGFMFLPLLIGIGMLVYNSKWRAGWIVLALGFALIIFSILAQLTIWFPFVSAITFILMFVPLAAGVALMVKGVQLRKESKKKNV